MAYSVGTIVSSLLASDQVSIDAPNFTAVAGDTLIVWLDWAFNLPDTITLSDTVGTNDYGL